MNCDQQHKIDSSNNIKMNTHKDIRLIQLSDCHISSDNQQQWFGRNPDMYLENLIHYINDNEAPDSIVIATGDLSHDGSESSYRKLSKNFSSLNKNIYTLAGNHDDLEQMARHLNQEKISTSTYFTQGNWLVLMLNTPVPDKEYGQLSEQEIIQVKKTLAKHQDKYVLIAMHHPPVRVGCAWIDNVNLQNSQAFMELVAQYKNIKAITYGHVHQDHTMAINGVDYFACPSTCHQYQSNCDDFTVDTLEAGYRWFDLRHDGHINSGVTRLPNNHHVS